MAVSDDYRIDNPDTGTDKSQTANGNNGSKNNRPHWVLHPCGKSLRPGLGFLYCQFFTAHGFTLELV